MLAGVIGVVGVGLISLSATLTKTAAPSGNIVTSDTVTVGVPGGSLGQLTFQSYSISGAVNTEYSKNGGAFTTVTEGSTITFANGDTLAVRGSLMASGESWTFTLKDQGRATILATYVITAS